MALAEIAEPTEASEPAGRSAPARSGTTTRRRGRRRFVAWIGIVPFFAYVTFFLLIPTGEVVINAFKGPSGGFTFSNVSEILHAEYLQAFEFSLEVAALSALMGGVLGFLVANAFMHHGVPRFLRSFFISFSGMASNFAGIPLAFAFVATLGSTGIVTGLLAHVGVHLGFTFLQGVLGLSVVYLYFQFPLMVLIVMPALGGLRKEWREAAESLGASSFAFWRYVGIPILAPSLLGMMVLLFGSAFAAYATAYALGVSNLVTIFIGNFINGNNTFQPQLAYALAFGMIVIITITIALYTFLQRRASRWLR